MKNKSIKNNNITEKIESDNEFNDIYNLMEYSKQNIFITGKAGAGKTTLLEYFRNNSKKNLTWYKNIINFLKRYVIL